MVVLESSDPKLQIGIETEQRQVARFPVQEHAGRPRAAGPRTSDGAIRSV